MALYTHLVPSYGILIETTVTHEASVAESWILNIRSTYINQKINIVGLNCKFKFYPIKSLSNEIATLQLCIDTKCLVIQLLHMKTDTIPQSVKDFLMDHKIIFVGVDMKETALKLAKEYGINFCKKIDVRALAKVHFPLSYSGKPGLKALVDGLVNLGSWKPKNLRLNNVEAKVLDEECVKFTCVDAYVCYKIGHKLLIECGIIQLLTF